MEGESSKTYEYFEAEDSESSEDLEAAESTDPDWLTIPKCRGNIGRLFASEESPFTMKSVQFDVLALSVQGVTISEYDKPKPAPVRGEHSASRDVVESLSTFVLEHDRPDWKCPVCLCTGEKGEELVEFPCGEHHLHLECGKRLLKSDNKCPHCRKEMLTGNAAYDSWLIKNDEEEEEKQGARKAIKGVEYMYV